MAAATYYFVNVLLIAILLSSGNLFTDAADPDPVQDFCVPGGSSGCKARVQGKDFASQALRNATNTQAPRTFGATTVDVSAFPALNTMGLSLVKGFIGVGGVIPLHVHPRSSELVYIEQGTVQVGFVDTNNVLYRHTLLRGDLFIVPRGLVHYLYNVGDARAEVIAVFNSQAPGLQLLGPSLFGSNLPDDVLELSLNLNQTMIDYLKSIHT